MQRKGPHCPGCTLEHLGQGFACGVKGSGPKLPLGVLIVAESLGEMEAIKSDYLVGKTGEFFDRLVSRTLHPTTGLPLHRNQFGLENTEHCRPPGDSVWGDGWGGKGVAIAALDQCRPYLEQSLRESRPKVILAMGVAALRFFTGRTNLESKSVSNVGYVFESEWGLVVPTWHPSHLLRGKLHLAQAWQLFLARAVQIAEKGLNRLPLNYLLYPTPEQARAFVAEYIAAGCPPLSADMETPYSSKKDEEDKDSSDEDLEAGLEGIDVTDPSWQILRVSFSWKPGYSITMPWMPPFTEVARELLATPGIKIFWNGLAYDVPRFEMAGYTVNGEIWDGMLFFGRYKPALPKKLGFVASILTDLPEWKSGARETPEFYSAVDPDAALRCTLKIVEGLKKDGMWESSQRHITEMFAALRRASKHGVNVDRVARKAKREEFQERVALEEANLQQYVPQELRKTQVFAARPSVFLKAAEKKRAAYLAKVEAGTAEPDDEPWDLTDGSWVLTQVEVELKPGWEVGPDGEERKIPKPPKIKKPRKPRGKKKVGLEKDAGSGRQEDVPQVQGGETPQ